MGIIRERRKNETRAMLVEAGLRLFAERGLELGTLDDVAEAAGFTKGAIYRQFPSKGAFLLALFEQYAAVARAAPVPAKLPGSFRLPFNSLRRRLGIRCCGGASPPCSRKHPMERLPRVNFSKPWPVYGPPDRPQP